MEKRESTQEIFILYVLYVLCALRSVLCALWCTIPYTNVAFFLPFLSPSSPLPLPLPRLLPLLGHGTNLDLSIPTLISTILSGKPCAHIACGAQHSLCTTKQNDLYCFGRGAEGQVRNIRNIQIWIIKFSWNFQL